MQKSSVDSKHRALGIVWDIYSVRASRNHQGLSFAFQDEPIDGRGRFEGASPRKPALPPDLQSDDPPCLDPRVQNLSEILWSISGIVCGFCCTTEHFLLLPLYLIQRNPSHSRFTHEVGRGKAAALLTLKPAPVVVDLAGQDEGTGASWTDRSPGRTCYQTSLLAPPDFVA